MAKKLNRRQRLGIVMLFAEVLVLQAAFLDVLRYFVPVHVPLASVVMLWAIAIGSAALLLWDK